MMVNNNVMIPIRSTKVTLPGLVMSMTLAIPDLERCFDIPFRGKFRNTINRGWLFEILLMLGQYGSIHIGSKIPFLYVQNILQTEPAFIDIQPLPLICSFKRTSCSVRLRDTMLAN